jgi:starvation-inducible DNA-binding protein
MGDTFTIPGLGDEATTIRSSLQGRLSALIDTALMLKHIHWNVVGPSFIGVHEMIDPQVAAVQLMADALAERIAALGGSPNGLVGHTAENREWRDYPLGRDLVSEHLKALDIAYSGLIGGHRAAMAVAGAIDPVTEDILIGQTGALEQFQWFVRAHLETSDGAIPTAATDREATNTAMSH